MLLLIINPEFDFSYETNFGTFEQPQKSGLNYAVGRRLEMIWNEKEIKWNVLRTENVRVRERLHTIHWGGFFIASTMPLWL